MGPGVNAVPTETATVAAAQLRAVHVRSRPVAVPSGKIRTISTTPASAGQKTHEVTHAAISPSGSEGRATSA
jgi:hypothetical protein